MGQTLRLTSLSPGAAARRSLLFGHYPTGVMVGLVLALATVVAAIHLPLGRAPGAVHWHIAGTGETIVLDALSTPRTVPRLQGAPVTRFEEGTSEPDASLVQDEEATTGDEPLPVRAGETSGRELGSMAVMTTAEIMPEIRGGLRNYYIHIEYPEAAARMGIEGRLVLDFTVGVDGAVRDIQVAQPLHPLCDSAAVRALRQTHFIPGRQDGRVIPVRMHLPVRFQLVDSPPEDAPARRMQAKQDS